MKRKRNGDVEWLEFPLFEDFPEVVHGGFLRHGGMSEAPFNSLNMCSSVGDPVQIVERNRKLVAESLHLKQVVSCHEVHGAHIIEIKDREQIIEPCDGLATRMREVGLLMTHADCQVALFYDPIEKVIGSAHCGWRGNVQNIYQQMVLFLHTRFGCRPENIFVCISPSLGPNRAEFKHFRDELPESFWPFQVKPTYFDLWSISRMQLETAGILREHIEIASICTYDHREDFFSYRREKKTGRHGTLLALRACC